MMTTCTALTVLDPQAVATLQHLSSALKSAREESNVEQRMIAFTDNTEQSVVAVYKKYLNVQSQIALLEKQSSEKETLLKKEIEVLKGQVGSLQQTIATLRKDNAELVRKADEKSKATLKEQRDAIQALKKAHQSELEAVRNEMRAKAIAEETWYANDLIQHLQKWHDSEERNYKEHDTREYLNYLGGAYRDLRTRQVNRMLDNYQLLYQVLRAVDERFNLGRIASRLNLI